MDRLGKPLSDHAASRSMSIMLNGLGGLLILGGLALIPMSLKMQGQDRQVVLLGTLLLASIGVGLMLLWRLLKPKATFVLHEAGVLVRGRDTQAIAFQDIAELHQARVGKVGIPLLGFRTNEGQPWTVVHGSVSRSGELSIALRNAHTDVHLPQALARLEQGDTLHFKYVPWTSRVVSRFSMGVEGHFQGSTKQLSLDATALRCDTKVIPVSSMADLEVSDWNGSFTLKDAQGNELLSMDAVSIYNSDLLLALLTTLMEKNHRA